MGIIGNAIGQGLGQGMVAVGQQMAANEQAQSRIEIERERLRQERELRLEEIRQRRETDELRYGASGGGSGGARGKGGIEEEMIRKYPEAFGIDTNMPKQDSFKKEVVTKTGTIDTVDTNNGEYTDAVSRKAATRVFETEQQPDQEAYGKAKKGLIESNIRNLNRVAAPGTYDDLEKGNAQAAINVIGERAMSEQDPKKREELVRDANKLAISLGGKERFKVSGNTVVDTATGDNAATDVGESIAAKNARPPVARTGSARPDNTALIEGGKDARAVVSSLERELRSEKANLTKVGPKDKPAVQARISKLEGELDTARSRIAKDDTPPKAADNPPRAETVARPATKEEFDKLPKGAKYINPADGKTYTKK